MTVIVRIRCTENRLEYKDVVTFKIDKSYIYLNYRNGGRSKLIRRNLELDRVEE